MAALSGVAGRDVPACLDEIWNNGVCNSDPRDNRDVIILLAVFLKNCKIEKKYAKKILKGWAKNAKGVCTLDSNLIESEVDRVYSGKEIFNCKIARGCRHIQENKLCDEAGCLFEQFPNEPEEDNCEDVNLRISSWIDQHHFITVTDTEQLYHYEHGVYLNNGETVLKTLIESEFADSTTEIMVRDVVGKVKRRTYIDRTQFNNKKFVNVKNGLLDLDTLEIKPHTPKYISTAQIDVSYDPNAKAPNIQKFIKDVVRPEDIPLIEEIFGWMLWPDYHVHKAVMMLGKGRNGKGTLLRLMTAFLGKENVSSVTLQALTADKFAGSDLFGKMANIGGDLPSRDLSDTATFRNLTGGDYCRAQEKYLKPFDFMNTAKMLFSANELPNTPDDTYAFFSRWIIIEFPNTFDIQSGTADPNLDAKLQTPEELSGFLNIALAGLARLKANGWRFSYDKTVEDVEIMYKRNANPVYAFLMDECEESYEDYIVKEELYQEYKKYAIKNNLRALSLTKFTQLLKDQTLIAVSDYRPWENGKAGSRAWMGIRLKQCWGDAWIDCSPYDGPIYDEDEEICGQAYEECYA